MSTGSLLHRLALLCMLLLAGVAMYAQDMKFYADVMVNADESSHRALASERFAELLESSLESDHSFDKPYKDLRWISIQYPSDSTFRVISWQVQYEKNKYRYESIFQHANGQIVKAAGRRGRKSYQSKAPISWGQWSGGLVYGIISPKQGEYYMQSFANVDQFNRAKTLEPMIIDGEDITLGKANVFSSPSSRSARISLEYSRDANATIQYIPESDRFVFDHLILVEGRMQGQGPTRVPDGSYQAYQRQGDDWRYVDMLEVNALNFDPPSTPKPKVKE